MYIRYEDTKDERVVLVVDELENYKGKVRLMDLLDLFDDDLQVVEENEYIYKFVDKQQLNLCFKSFSRENGK